VNDLLIKQEHKSMVGIEIQTAYTRHNLQRFSGTINEKIHLFVSQFPLPLNETTCNFKYHYKNNEELTESIFRNL